MAPVCSQFRPGELQILRRLDAPEKIQRFLDEKVIYNREHGEPTCRSPRRVLRDRTAHCLEGALLAAAALRVNGHPALLMDLEAVRDDDHVVALYRRHRHWGAIAKSNYSGLRFREPVYRTLRELALSYFEHYCNPEGEKTLRRYSRPVSLRRFDPIGWMTSEEDLWAIPRHLLRIPHASLLPAELRTRRYRVDERLFLAAHLGAVD